MVADPAVFFLSLFPFPPYLYIKVPTLLHPVSVWISPRTMIMVHVSVERSVTCVLIWRENCSSDRISWDARHRNRWSAIITKSWWTKAPVPNAKLAIHESLINFHRSFSQRDQPSVMLLKKEAFDYTTLTLAKQVNFRHYVFHCLIANYPEAAFVTVIYFAAISCSSYPLFWLIRKRSKNGSFLDLYFGIKFHAHFLP